MAGKIVNAERVTTVLWFLPTHKLAPQALKYAVERAQVFYCKDGKPRAKFYEKKHDVENPIINTIKR